MAERAAQMPDSNEETGRRQVSEAEEGNQEDASSADGQLSTSPEENSQDSELISDYLQRADEEIQRLLDSIPVHPDLLAPTSVEPVDHDPLGDRMPLSLLMAPADSLVLAEPHELDHSAYVELVVYPPAIDMLELSDLPERPVRGEIVLLQMGPNKVRQFVVHRDDDVLTSAQSKEHWLAVRKAMLKELQTWDQLKCFSRRPRKGARNVINVRWVIKFKWEVPTVDMHRGGGQSTEAAKPVRTIRARLTVRGFRDCERGDIDRYAGTSTRCSQKLIVSEAVRNGWPICTADISKPFLQGATHEQLAEMTGEPVREVNFYLPVTNIPLL